MPQTTQNFNHSELCFAKRLCRRIIFRTLLRKAVCDRRIFLCGSLVKAFCYAKRSIVKILLRKTAYSELCFAKWLRHRIYLCGSLASAVFAVFDRPVFFGVHTCMVNSFKALADGMSYSYLCLKFF